MFVEAFWYILNINKIIPAKWKCNCLTAVGCIYVVCKNVDKERNEIVNILIYNVYM